MIGEHEQAKLTVDLADEGLRAGDVGTVVHVHRNGVAYEVEFSWHPANPVLTLTAAQVRPVSGPEMAEPR